IAIGDTDIWAVGPEAANGVFTKLWWYNNPNNPPEEKAFADAYMKKHNRPAADKAWMGWITAKSLSNRSNWQSPPSRWQSSRGWRIGSSVPAARPTATASGTTRCC